MTDTNPVEDTATAKITKTFDDMPLSDEVRLALSDMGYDSPTPVQHAVWEPMAAGDDVVVQARTGTGKTTAFGLPVVDRLVDPEGDYAQSLILCPTRELALQVTRELDKLAKHKKLNVVPIYGGAAIQPQITALDKGAQIIVGTPGRVLDLLRREALDPSRIASLVLDESDEMLSMGFERELTAIVDRLPEERQTLLFSATLPADIQRMAKTRLKEPTFVTLSGDHVGALQIRHLLYRSGATLDKTSVLLQVLDIENPESAIIFCNTREQTEVVSKRLCREGYEAAWINGDLAQAERERVMRRTREGKLRFLVATDVAARGIDISHLTHVINFDFPPAAETYIHRTGRTGRAGRTGTAIAIVTPQDVGSVYLLSLTYKIRPIERQLPTLLEEQTRRQADVIAALRTAYSSRGAQETSRALARRVLIDDDAENIVAGLLEQHFVTEPDVQRNATEQRRAKIAAPIEARTPEEEGAAPAGDMNARSSASKTSPDDDKKAGRTKSRRARRSRRTDKDAERRDPETRGAPKPDDKTSPEEQAMEAASDGSSVPDHRVSNDKPSKETTRAGTELHVNAGRRHGAGVRVLKSLLTEAGIPTDALGRCRVREKYSFVEVDGEFVEAALSAFNAAKVGEHQVAASLSERAQKS